MDNGVEHCQKCGSLYSVYYPCAYCELVAKNKSLKMCIELAIKAIELMSSTNQHKEFVDELKKGLKL